MLIMKQDQTNEKLVQFIDIHLPLYAEHKSVRMNNFKRN